jgi:hypothetical protein
MAQITNLNELVPEDLVFVYGNPPVEYEIPGDLSGEIVFKLFRMFGDLSVLMRDAETLDEDAKVKDVRARVTRLSAQVDKTLLELFQIRTPDMTELPFGSRSMPIIIRDILRHLGLGVADTDADPPKPPAPNRKTRRSGTSSRQSSSRK